MKKIFILILAMCFSISSYAKTLYVDDFVKVFNGLSGDKSILYNNVEQWLAINFKSSKDAIQYENRDQGRIIIKGITSPLCDDKLGRLQCSGYSQAKIGFTLTIDIQDGRVRFLFSDAGYALHNNYPIDDPITYRLTVNRFEKISQDFGLEINKISENQNW